MSDPQLLGHQRTPKLQALCPLSGTLSDPDLWRSHRGNDQWSHQQRNRSLPEGIVPTLMLSQEVVSISSTHSSLADVRHRELPSSHVPKGRKLPVISEPGPLIHHCHTHFSHGWFFVFVFVFVFFIFLGLHPLHMEVPRLGVQSELQLSASTPATAMRDPSCACDLHHCSGQCQILNPLSKARDHTRNLVVPSQICFRCAMMGTPFMAC